MGCLCSSDHSELTRECYIHLHSNDVERVAGTLILPPLSRSLLSMTSAPGHKHAVRVFTASSPGDAPNSNINLSLCTLASGETYNGEKVVQI